MSLIQRKFLAGGLLALLALAAYWNSFHAPFVFDDHESIDKTPTIRNLTAIGEVLSPPRDGSGVTGRPVRYLALSVWPHPLNLDYGEDLAVHPIGGWWCGLFLVALAAATALAIYRRSALGFLGAWFFAILAPSSSVVPLLTQTIAEHRMYLPLAALAVLAVAAVQRRLRHHGAYVPIRLNLAYELAKSPRTDTRGDSPARHRPAVGSRQRHGAQ